MEELRSTENLDKEILEEARKKSDKLVKNAAQVIAASQSTARADIERGLAAEEQKLQKKLEQEAGELDAALTLEKKRAQLGFYVRVQAQALEAFFKAMPRDAALRLLKSELVKLFEKYFSLEKSAASGNADAELFASFCADVTELRYSGLTSAELSTVLAAAAANFCGGDGGGESVNKLIAAAHETKTVAADAPAYPELSIISAHVRISASLETLFLAMLSDKRAELLEALIGRTPGGAPPDGGPPREKEAA
jgi:hypothetical protein